jgi:hypothetical protein
MRAPAWLIALSVAVCSFGCGTTVDLSTALQMSDVSTGWHDAGVVDGKNKLVPSVSFKLTNSSDQSLTSLQVNALFRRVTEPDEWGSGYVKVTGSEGLGPGQSTKPLTVASALGYTGTESRLELLQNRSFVDAKVEVFAKFGSSQWTRLGEYPIERQLSTP